jgi:hypothetical protein
MAIKPRINESLQDKEQSVQNGTIIPGVRVDRKNAPNSSYWGVRVEVDPLAFTNGPISERAIRLYAERAAPLTRNKPN